MRTWLTVADVAARLGVKEVTVRAYAQRKQMPPAHACPSCGHTPVWRAKVIEKWHAKRPRKSDT